MHWLGWYLNLFNRKYHSVPLTTRVAEESLSLCLFLLTFLAFSFKTASFFLNSKVLSKIGLILLSSPECSRTERLWLHSHFAPLKEMACETLAQLDKIIKL